MHSRLIATCAAICLLGGLSPPALAAKGSLPTTWDGLAQIQAKRFDAAYLLPGADFKVYHKVILDSPEVAFQKNWVRDYNSTVRGLDGRINDSDAVKAREKVRVAFEEVFRGAFSGAGYAIVTQPGPDVLRVRTAVVNLYANAPDMRNAGRTRSYSEEAGAATVIVELKDSSTGALLGRVIDGKIAGDTGAYIRNSVTNRADFTLVFKRWAKSSVDGLAELKARSPLVLPVAQR